MSEKTPEFFMRRAIAISKRGYPAPNPRVGCVVVLDGEIVGEGYHRYAGGPHAEVVALKRAGARANGATAYVTLEPCNHFGKTPPCAPALIAAGVKKVVYAVADPNQIATGGAAKLSSVGVIVEGGLLCKEAEDANRRFLTAMRLRRPFVVLKAAMSLDGRIALPNGQSKWITGPLARREGHKLRAEMGAVLVGSGTVATDHPRLTARIPGVRNQPVRIEIGGGTGYENGWTFHTPASTTVLYPHRLEIAELLSDLFDKGITGVLVEGGAGVYSSFLQSGIVDEIELFVAPIILGSGLTWANLNAPGAKAPSARTSEGYLGIPARFSIDRVRRVGDDLQISLSGQG